MNRKAKALEFVDAEYNIQITGRHLQVTESMKDYAREKISKIERFNHRISEINVIMDVQKLDHRVEIIVKTGNLKMKSSASTSDMYASIDKAVEKLEAQVLRYKSKMQDHHAKTHPAVDMTIDVIQPQQDDEEIEELDHIKTPFKPYHVVQQEVISVKTLTFDEAIFKMEFSDAPFMIFKNEADQKLKIIYRNKDGNYGIIEPTS